MLIFNKLKLTLSPAWLLNWLRRKKYPCYCALYRYFKECDFLTGLQFLHLYFVILFISATLHCKLIADLKKKTVTETLTGRGRGYLRCRNGS